MMSIFIAPPQTELVKVFYDIARSRRITYQEFDPFVASGTTDADLTKGFPDLTGMVGSGYGLIGANNAITLCYLMSSPELGSQVEIFGAKDSQRMIFTGNHFEVSVIDLKKNRALAKMNGERGYEAPKRKDDFRTYASPSEFKLFLDELLDR